MLGITTTEAWVRLLREIFSYTSKGDGPARVPVQVSTGFPFADIPDNSNLPNDPTLATLSSKGAVNLPNRRDLTLPEITVHDLGESMPKKYMDNFIGYFYSKEIKIVKDMVPKISRIKNVFLEQPNKKTLVLKENEHFVFDRERGAIVFEIEFYPYIPLGTKTKYIADLFFETQAGIAEHIGEGVIESGEIFGTLHSLEVDAKLQIDLWGGNQKQAQWLLQRFREMWINERLLRQNLARHGLSCTMNLSWDHGGIKSSLDGRFRPYMYNITCKVYFNTEYKVLTLVSDYAERFKDLDAAVAIYDRVPPAIDGMPARRYTGLLAVEPYNVGYVLLGGYPKI